MINSGREWDWMDGYVDEDYTIKRLIIEISNNI